MWIHRLNTYFGLTTERRQHVILLAALLLSCPVAAAKSRGAEPSPPSGVLRVDPRLIAEAAEVWSIIGTDHNPIWPGWNASHTPILFYLPGVQDLLINHPSPPEGFVPYVGPVRFPGGRMDVKDGPTILGWDGQNTSKEVAGVRTLIVADSLSNLRLQIGGLMEDPRPASEKLADLSFSFLATDPYSQMRLIVHEAFHVFQSTAAPEKDPDEMLLLRYPVLSEDNNVGFALEGAALAEALRAREPAVFRKAMLRWIAIRTDRRMRLPKEAVVYEDAVEFSEGLAEYAEYRLFEALTGRTPGPDIWWAQGFAGYGALAEKRTESLDEMLKHMRGEANVNNDPYGTAPLRKRLYYSGMAIAAALDTLSGDWKTRIFMPNVSLTDLAIEAIAPSRSQMEEALKEVRAEQGYLELVEAKRKLAIDGRAELDRMLAQIENGSGTGIILDYSGLPSAAVGMAITPFGIRSVDADRTIYTQIPVQAQFADGSEVAQTEPTPLLRDTNSRVIRFRLSKEISPDELKAALGTGADLSKAIQHLDLSLPGMTLRATNARLRWDGRNIRITLMPLTK